MRSASSTPVRWTVVLPVKSAERAKSRLVAPAGVDHDRLARAIALDALAAVRRSVVVEHRIVVTSDAVIGPSASAAGDLVVPDAGRGLGAAVVSGAALAGRLGCDEAVAVLLPDLPALRARDLDAALRAASGHASALVPDAQGTGTVLLTANAPHRLRPAFGKGSASRHSRLGAARLDLDLPRLRRDVDTLQDLQAAAALGLGAETAAAVATATAPGWAFGAGAAIGAGTAVTPTR